MSRADSPQSPTRHRTQAGLKRKSQKQSAARHDDAGLTFPWLPDALNMISAWRLAIRRKQARPEHRKQKKLEMRVVGAGTLEEADKALAKSSKLLRSELFHPLKLSIPSPAARRAGNLLVTAREMAPEVVIEMPGMLRLAKQQPALGLSRAYSIGVPKKFVIRLVGLPTVIIIVKEPAGRPRGRKGRPRRTLWFKKEFVSRKLSVCFQKTGVTDAERRVLYCFWRHQVRRAEEEQQWQTKKKRAGGHNPWALQRAVASELRVSEAYVSQTLRRVYKKMEKYLPLFSHTTPTYVPAKPTATGPKVNRP